MDQVVEVERDYQILETSCYQKSMDRKKSKQLQHSLDELIDRCKKISPMLTKENLDSIRRVDLVRKKSITLKEQLASF